METITATTFYIMVGLGAHMESADCPEVCFGGNELAKVEAGIDYKLNRNHFINGQIWHVSNPTLKESGYGMNAAFINYKFTF